MHAHIHVYARAYTRSIVYTYTRTQFAQMNGLTTCSSSIWREDSHTKSSEERRIRRRKKKKNAKSRFFTSHGAYVNCAIIAMLYTHSIGNQP